MQLSYVPIDRQRPNRVAVTYGPVVLVREESSALAAGKGDLARGMHRDGEALEFRMETQMSSRFLPFYKLGFGSVYHMYLDRL